MQFTCNTLDLIVAINTVSKAISNRTANPILSCMLLKAEGNDLYLIGTDLELSIKSKINANIQQGGSLALDAKLFPEIIRRLPEGLIEITSDENNYATIKCGKLEYKLAGQAGADYPELPVVEKNNAIVMFQDDLRNMIKSTIFSIATEETKPILMGELLEIENNEVTLVAVDGYRISAKKGIVSNNAGSLQAIIPGKNMNELSKILSSDKEDKMNVYFTDRNVLFELDNSIIISRLIEGKFINYKQNLKDDYETSFKVDKATLLNSVERISLISGIDKKQPIKIEMSGSELILSSNTTAGQGHEEIEISKEGPDLTIAFNPKFLLDVLRVIDEEEVTLTFKNSLTPCIIKSEKNDSYKYLILPLRLNA
ncbi:MAG: DNA polymerase III subunit beta [archaeon]|nr:DNA polymerase III subunit beta [archaeon]